MKFLYQFSARQSFVHRLDPRSKLLFILCFLISTFLSPYPWLMPLAIIAIIWLLAGISPLEYLPFLLFMLPLMFAITLVHLLADGPGRFAGRNMQYSGDGFANQYFAAIAMSDQDFAAWVAKAKEAPETLDAAAYERLAKPSELHPVTYYAAFAPDLFARIIARYAPAGPGAPHAGLAPAARR